MSLNDVDLLVLKAITTNKKLALDFAAECDPNLFAPEFWNFAKILVGYVRNYKEIPTLRVMTERLAKGNNDKLIEAIKRVWEQLEKVNYNDREYKYDLERLKKRFAEKQISTIKDTFSKMEAGSMDVNKAVSEMQKTVQAIQTIHQPKSFDRRTIKEALPAFVERFNAKRKNPKMDEGLKVGYSFFDFATNGVKPADFVLIAGESGFGKSLLLNNMGVQTWLQENTLDTMDNFKPGKNIIYFSLEMPYDDCFNRLLSRLSGVPSRRIDNADIDHEDFAKLKKAMDFINRYPYHFEIVDIADACANDLEHILNDTQFDVDAIFIDYLGIMKPNQHSDEADWLKQGIIAYETRAIARKYKLPVFSAVQLNRKSNAKESSENIGLSRLARSATIATHATTVIQIENRPMEENYPDFIYHIIKNRKGPKGKGKLIKNLSCATLLDDKVEEDTTVFEMRDPDDISDKIELLNL